jgi:NADPH-dependent glutamate synthase beta subunit-like oxidoreductase/formate hydrogenlyase subunit 6/NADH:ubiquinone oxidoreductase subunit I
MPMARQFGNGIARGLTVTLKNLLRGPITVQYPEQRLNVSRRERGSVLAWSAQKCTGCYTCERNCPHGCIHIETAPGATKWTERAPCAARCPAHVDAARYIRALTNGEPGEAVAVNRESMPFPTVCAYVCAHPCQGACTRGPMDEPIAIRMLKRYAVDHDTGIWKTRIAKAQPTGKRVAVVGAGPAGLTAAYYLARRGHSVTIFEALAVAGGMVKVGIPDYRLPKDLLLRDIKVIEDAGVEIKLNHPVDSLPALFHGGFQAVLVAIGAHQAQGLGVPGDDDPRVLGGVVFLKEVNLGSQVTLGKRVAVIGGGNTAMDSARTAARLGAEVTVIYRRTRAEMPAAPEEIEEAIEEGVKFSFLAAPTRVVKQDGHLFLENVRMKLGAEDSSGRRKPEPVKGSEYLVELDNIIAAISQNPIVPAGFGLATDKSSRVQVDPGTLSAPQAGIFAAGDCVLGPATVIEAVAQGKQAAISMDKFLGGSGDIKEVLASPDTFPVRQDGPAQGFQPAREMIPHEKRLHSFEGVEIGWEKAQAEAECARCLRCDLMYPVETWDLKGGLCIYCGLCVEACPFQALYMGYDYERTHYRFAEHNLHKEDLKTPQVRRASAYAHPELANDLPAQSLLVDKGRKENKNGKSIASKGKPPVTEADK